LYFGNSNDESFSPYDLNATIQTILLSFGAHNHKQSLSSSPIKAHLANQYNKTSNHPSSREIDIMSHFNPYNNGTNTLISMRAGSFDDYDSIDGEFSIQMAQTDDESMAMSELGSVLGGVSVIDQQQRAPAPFATSATNEAASINNATDTYDMNPSEIQQIKSSEDKIYEDDNNTSYDVDCASFMNSELGITAGDVSAILFGGRSANYQQTQSTGGEYMNGLFVTGYDSNVESHVNTSVDDTVGDLLARDDGDDTTVMDSIIGPALETHLQKRPKKLGPLGDELSYAQDDSTAPPAPESLPYNEGGARDLHVEIDMHDDEMEEEEEVTRGILPVWLSTSNSRMKSLLVVSAALIVGSLVMAVVALGANSHWWSADESGKEAGGMASFSSEMNNGDSGEMKLFEEPTMVPSFKPTQKQTKKPTRKPTKSPVLEETGETPLTVVDTESTEMDTATSETTSTSTTSEATTTTTVATDAPTATITPSTESPIESPTLMPSDSTLKPVTDSPTLSKFNICFVLFFVTR
jgi:hypothetical protein